MTMLEMLISLAVIAALAILAFPAIQKARAGALRTGCMQNLRTIGLGITGYAQDHRGKLPGPQFEIIDMNQKGHMVFRLAPYMEGSDRTRTWTCPANRWMADRNRSMAQHNASYLSHYPWFGYKPAAKPEDEVFAKTLQEIRQNYSLEQQWLLNDADFWNYPNAAAIGGSYDPVHDGGRNVLFLDSRVVWVKSKRGVRP